MRRYSLAVDWVHSNLTVMYYDTANEVMDAIGRIDTTRNSTTPDSVKISREGKAIVHLSAHHIGGFVEFIGEVK
jgi:hypothetical protein